MNKKRNYRDGDILYVKTKFNNEFIFIYKFSRIYKTFGYIGISLLNNTIYFNDGYSNRVCENKNIVKLRLAIKDEINFFKDKLKNSKLDKVNYYLKKYFKN